MSISVDSTIEIQDSKVFLKHTQLYSGNGRHKVCFDHKSPTHETHQTDNSTKVIFQKDHRYVTKMVVYWCVGVEIMLQHIRERSTPDIANTPDIL